MAAEIWKWFASQLEYWFVMLWWFTGGLFILSAVARWSAGRRIHPSSAEDIGWLETLLAGITASWRGDRERLARRLAERGEAARFALGVTAAHILPLYVPVLIFGLGKEYLLVYLLAVTIDLAVVTAAAAGWLAVSTPGGPSPEAAAERSSLWGGFGRELVAAGPRWLYGFAVAALLAALAIHPAWTFPVEITGGGLAAQVVNGMLGAALAVGAWAPPVGVLFLAVSVWRSGFALTGLLTLMLSIPAAPQSVAMYAEVIGRRQATRFLAIVLVSALLSAVLTTLLVAALGLELPYQYAAEQTL